LDYKMNETTKKIIITGVNGGIGSAICKKFMEEGFHVVGLDKSTQKEDCHTFHQFDIHHFIKNRNYFDKWSAKFKQLDQVYGLINNAAVQILESFTEIQLSSWNESMNVNVTGPLFLSKIFHDDLVKHKGSIVNIASIHQSLTKPRFVNYATSKSALVGLTKSMAVDLEGSIIVNSISPAAISTPMLLAGFGGDQDALNLLQKLHPAQRIGTPEEVAELTHFLITKNKGFINGANFTLDGGISSVLHDL